MSVSGERSRRSILAAMAGGAAAFVANAFGRPQATQAAGEIVHLGDLLTTEVKTEIRNEANTEVVVRVASVHGNALHGLTQAGTGVLGAGDSGTGVRATSSSGTALSARSSGGHGIHAESGQSTAISAFSEDAVGLFVYSLSEVDPALIANAGADRTAIFGYSGFQVDPPAPPKTGVYGLATQDSGAVGVRGKSTTGTGVLAEAGAGGTALRVAGKAAFSKSGVLTVAAGKRSAAKNVTGLSSSSLVFAVVRSGDTGAYVRRVKPAAGSFTVHLNKSVGVSTTISWIAFG